MIGRVALAAHVIAAFEPRNYPARHQNWAMLTLDGRHLGKEFLPNIDRLAIFN